MTINLFWMAKWAILLGLLFGGAGSAQPVERVGLEELLARQERQERQERAIYWVGLASGMALLHDSPDVHPPALSLAVTPESSLIPACQGQTFD